MQSLLFKTKDLGYIYCFSVRKPNWQRVSIDSESTRRECVPFKKINGTNTIHYAIQPLFLLYSTGLQWHCHELQVASKSYDPYFSKYLGPLDEDMIIMYPQKCVIRFMIRPSCLQIKDNENPLWKSPILNGLVRDKMCA